VKEKPEVRIWFLVVLAVAAAASLLPPALRAHVELLSGRQLAEASPHVVVAVVEGRQSRWNPQHTLILTDYTLRIEDRLKGQAADRVTISVPGGTIGRVTDETCVSVSLEPGARYLLFLGDLSEPTFTPVTGASQGAFRERPEKTGGPSFADLVQAARVLVAEAEASPLPPELPLKRRPGGLLPAKRYDPAPRSGGSSRALPPLLTATLEAPAFQDGLVEVRALPKDGGLRPAVGAYVAHELADAPVSIDPIPQGNPFYGEDQKGMAYWNLYAGDLFRIVDSPSDTWAYGNRVFDIAGFPDDAQMQQQFGYKWDEIGTRVLGVAFLRREEGRLTEADVALNPSVTWSLDLAEGTSRPGPYSFQEVIVHELGHVWGLDHPWEAQHVTWDSVLNYKFKEFYVGTLYADDTKAARDIHTGVRLRDGLVSSYVTQGVPFDETPPDYVPARPAVSSIKRGKSFGLTSPIKMENVGTEPIKNPTLEVYLVPQRFSFAGAILLKKIRLKGTIQSEATLRLSLGKLRVPPGIEPGTYYLAYFLRDKLDSYQDNNGAWSNDKVTITVTR
jgi:hypothetical protein